jgi:hypothetical protein
MLGTGHLSLLDTGDGIAAALRSQGRLAMAAAALLRSACGLWPFAALLLLDITAHLYNGRLALYSVPVLGTVALAHLLITAGYLPSRIELAAVLLGRQLRLSGAAQAALDGRLPGAPGVDSTPGARIAHLLANAESYMLAVGQRGAFTDIRRAAGAEGSLPLVIILVVLALGFAPRQNFAHLQLMSVAMASAAASMCGFYVVPWLSRRAAACRALAAELALLAELAPAEERLAAAPVIELLELPEPLPEIEEAPAERLAPVLLPPVEAPVEDWGQRRWPRSMKSVLDR